MFFEGKGVNSVQYCRSKFRPPRIPYSVFFILNFYKFFTIDFLTFVNIFSSDVVFYDIYTTEFFQFFHFFSPHMNNNYYLTIFHS